MMEKKEQTTNKTKHTDTHKLESQSKVTIDGALGGGGRRRANDATPR